MRRVGKWRDRHGACQHCGVLVSGIDAALGADGPTRISWGLLDGEPARNTQITRLAYILRKIAAGQEARVYPVLARYTRRTDGESYVSENPAWMESPEPLSHGWFFEGCANLEQKQWIVQALTKVGISPFLVNCIDEFVAGKSIAQYHPSESEADELLRRSIARERADDAGPL